MKKLIISIFLILVLSVGAFAQGQPVIDITAIIAFLENLQQLKEQYQNSVMQLQNSAKQLDQMVKTYQKPDFSKLDAKDPLGSWGVLMSQANRQMEYVNRVESTLNTKNMKIGNYSFSISDMLSIDENGDFSGMRGISESAVKFAIFDPFTERTPEEKAAFHAKYGMSPSNYMRYHQMGSAVDRAGARVKAELKEYGKKQLEEQKAMQEIVKQAGESENEHEKSQAQINLIARTGIVLDSIDGRLLEIQQMMYKDVLEKKITEDEIKNDMTGNDHNFSQGFVELMDMIDARPVIGNIGK